MWETRDERKSDEVITWLTQGVTWPMKCSGTTGLLSGSDRVSGHEYKAVSVSKFMFFPSHN